MEHGPCKSPIAGNVARIVAARAEHEHLRHELPHIVDDFGVDIVRQRKMRHGIRVHSVDPGGEDADVGLVCASEGRDDSAEDFAVDFVLGAGGKGNVDVVAVAGAVAKFVFKAGVPGEKRSGGLVEGNVENAGLVVEGELDAVAVVGVDIEVDDAASLLEKILDSDDNIIEVAEPGCVIRAGMMEAARGTEDKIDIRL